MLGFFKRSKNNGRDGDSAGENSPKPKFEIEASMQTDVGCLREVNEDSGRHNNPNDPKLIASKGVLAIVCDGMGGHACGEVASRMAVEIISRSYYEDAKPPTEALKRAIEAANAQVHAASARDANLRGMGTTCVALALYDGQAFAAHVGDSRLYMLREGELYQMTEDHSAVNEMVRQGIITAEQARTHEEKNVILRALGTTPAVEVETWEQPMRARLGDQFLLCSDGLYDMVEDAAIKQTMLSAKDAHEACARLVAQAREGGGHDNITVGVIRLQPAGHFNQQEIRATRELEVQG